MHSLEKLWLERWLVWLCQCVQCGWDVFLFLRVGRKNKINSIEFAQTCQRAKFYISISCQIARNRLLIGFLHLHTTLAALRRWRFLPLNYLRSTDFKFTKNCHTKHCTATFAKPLLGAGVLVFRVCKPLSLLSFSVLFLVVLVCAVAYFLFSEGEEIFFNSILSAWERWKLFCKLWSVLGLVRLANVLTPVR